MLRILPASCVTFLGLVLLLPTLAVRAQEVQVEIVQPPMHFLTADTGREDRKIEPSGVALIGNGRLLLVACDKNACLSVVEAATGWIKQSFSVGSLTKGPSGRTWHTTMREPTMSLAHVSLKSRLKRGRKSELWPSRVCCVFVCVAMAQAERHSRLTQNRSSNGI